MKTSRKFILRLLVLPFIVCIHLISYIYCAFRHSYLFLLHGGEWVNYNQKDISIQEVYNEVKNQLIFQKITAEAIKDFDKIKENEKFDAKND